MSNPCSYRRRVGPTLDRLESRVNFAGEIDHAFAANGLLNLSAGGAAIDNAVIAVQGDGKIVVAGSRHGSGNTAVVRRYLANGSPDTGFGTGGVRTIPNVKAYTIDRVTVLASGRIQVTGQQTIRLTSGGQIDTGFGGGDGVAPSQLAADKRSADYVFSDGSSLELSAGLTIGGGSNRVFKYKADGSPDKAFGTNGSTAITFPDILSTRGLAVDASGRIYVSFASLDPDIGGFDLTNVMRLTAAGKRDATWGTNGVASTDGGLADPTDGLTVLKDGRVAVIVRQQSEGQSRGFFHVFASDGDSYETIEPVHTGAFFPAEIVQASGGNLLIGGYYYEADGFDDFYGRQFAAVLNTDANFNTKTSFTPDHDGVGGFRVNGVNETGFRDIALTPAGDILIAGASDDDATGPRSDLVRLEGVSKFNKVSSVYANGVLTVNGSGKADSFIAETTDAFDFGLPNAHVLHYDWAATTVSPDIELYPFDGPKLTRVDMLLNGGDDYGDCLSLDLSTRINGGGGNDVIFGGRRASTLRGGDGDDDLYSGPGIDYLYGDAGDDQLSYDVGVDFAFP